MRTTNWSKVVELAENN
jgi:hypothetical protein